MKNKKINFNLCALELLEMKNKELNFEKVIDYEQIVSNFTNVMLYEKENKFLYALAYSEQYNCPVFIFYEIENGDYIIFKEANNKYIKEAKGFFHFLFNYLNFFEEDIIKSKNISYKEFIKNYIPRNFVNKIIEEVGENENFEIRFTDKEVVYVSFPFSRAGGVFLEAINFQIKSFFSAVEKCLSLLNINVKNHLVINYLAQEKTLKVYVAIINKENINEINLEKSRKLEKIVFQNFNDEEINYHIDLDKYWRKKIKGYEDMENPDRSLSFSVYESKNLKEGKKMEKEFDSYLITNKTNEKYEHETLYSFFTLYNNSLVYEKNEKFFYVFGFSPKYNSPIFVFYKIKNGAFIIFKLTNDFLKDKNYFYHREIESLDFYQENVIKSNLINYQTFIKNYKPVYFIYNFYKEVHSGENFLAGFKTNKNSVVYYGFPTSISGFIFLNAIDFKVAPFLKGVENCLRVFGENINQHLVANTLKNDTYFTVKVAELDLKNANKIDIKKSKQQQRIVFF